MAPAGHDLSRLPFDHYGRYALSQRVVNLLRPREAGAVFSVLDVGGHASSLKHFLPSDEVVVVDPLMPPAHTHRADIPFSCDGYLLASGMNLPLADGSFDIVTAHDTLEHIAETDRPSFLRELLRIARRFVILNGPVHRPETARSEARVSAFSQAALSWENPYLREHLEYGLPHKESIEAILQEQSLLHVTIPNGSLFLWTMMMAIRHYLMALPDSARLQEAIDTSYNRLVAAGDVGGLSYRDAYLIAKEVADRGCLAKVEASIVPNGTGHRSLDDPALLESVLNGLQEHAAGVRQLLDQLRASLVEKDVALAHRDQSLAERDATLAERDALLSRHEEELRRLDSELREIQQSLGYRLLERYRRLIRGLFPAGSWRGIPYQASLGLVRFLALQPGGLFKAGWRKRLARLPKRSLDIIRREGWRAFFSKVKRRLSGQTYGAQPPQIEMVEEVTPLTFPKPHEPLVSIVIPVFNKSLYTFNCLLSVLRNTEDVAFEVIVVDDASTDDTQSILAQIENIRVQTNPRNMGFVHTCNSGALSAEGKYLVFLNNDTQVHKRWLEALIDVAENDASVGLVGAKLLFPDGRLQEAGGIVWRDASAWNYGRLDDPEKPEYNYVREVDYCSGACVLVRRELFDKVGGFDPLYAPAYYEDTDLAFSVRKIGYRVVYQPSAVVTHFEGITAGTDTSSGTKRFQEVNRHKFRDRWRDVLESEHLPNGRELLLARDRRRADRVLVIDHFVPSYDRDAGSLRMYQILKILAKLGLAVTFVPGNMVRAEPYTSALQRAGIEVLYGPKDVSELLRDLGPYLRLALISRPDVAATYVPLVRKYAPNATLIYDTVDLHFLREERRAEVESSESVRRSAQRYRHMELALANGCDATVVVTEAERQLLLELSSGLDVHVIPTIHDIHTSTTPVSRRQGILFVGSFLHPPNVDAAIHLVTSILPLITTKIGPVDLYLVGAEPPPEIRALASERVIVTGWVEDLSPYLESTRVFVAPLRYGAGLKGKISQSMSYGLPLVTTSLGIEGMDIEDGREALVADDPAEFAAKVIRVYLDDDLWNHLAEHAARFAAANYSPEVVRTKLIDVLQQHGVKLPSDSKRALALSQSG